LKALVDSKNPLNVIAAEMKKTYAAVLKKCERLALEVDDTKRLKTSTSIPIPEYLPSIEEALKKLARARSGRSRRLKMLSTYVTELAS
jgi:hypothetical protein